METVIPIISLIASVMAVAISYYSFRRTQRASIMPVLVFSRRSGVTWEMENVGQGPAISVSVGDKEQNGKWRWSVKCYPIAAGASIEVPWPGQGDEFMASYTDIKGRAYSTHCNMSENNFYEENKFPDLKPSIDEASLKATIERFRREF